MTTINNKAAFTSECEQNANAACKNDANVRCRRIPEARQTADSQLRGSLRSLLAHRTLGTPKDNGVDASIDIFLVASLEYHLI